jgi:hypothetical protein
METTEVPRMMSTNKGPPVDATHIHKYLFEIVNTMWYSIP